MYMHPDMLRQLVNDHQRQLLREAEVERLVRHAHAGQPTLFMRARLSVSALLFAADHVVRPGNAERSTTVSDARSHI